MRVLVTGATGFVGSHAVRELVDRGFEVRLLARTPSKVPAVLGPLGVTVDDVVQGDMTDAAAVSAALEGCDAVLHCAAEVGVSGGSAATLGTANVDGARNVLGLAAEKGLDPIVWTSTVSAYIPTEDAVLTLDSPLAEPLSSYGAQKRDIEVLSRSLADDGHPVVSVVLGGVYGPVSPHLDSAFAAVLGGLSMGMVAPAGGIGMVDVRDVATALTNALVPGQGPRRYLMTGTYVTWEGWAVALGEAAGVPVPYTEVTRDQMLEMGRQFDELRAAGTPDLPPLSEEAAVIMSAGVPGDDALALEELGITYRPVVDTFRDTVDWLRSQGHV
jgi:nucleoside-diphosphate-sugar epimerase